MFAILARVGSFVDGLCICHRQCRLEADNRASAVLSPKSRSPYVSAVTRRKELICRYGVVVGDFLYGLDFGAQEIK